ncbi:MAG: DUF2076 family protein [Bryobacteraceae bacterium]
MTPDERKMLSDLADRIAQTPPPPRDPEAEELIRKRIGSRPDALYLMTQTVLIQNLALQQAQEQIQQLQRGTQPSSGSAGASFLGQQIGARASAPAYSTRQQQYAAPPPQYAPPSPAGPSPSGAPSFLRGAAQTAAGVAAGALAFEGIQALFSHPGYGGGGLGGFGGPGLMGGTPGETVINNYYDTPGGGDVSGGPGNDVYAPDDTTNFDDPSNMQDVNDSSQFDDSGPYEDSSDFGDSGGGFDDGGGGDSFV